MAATDDIFCDICNGRHITKPAEHWCPECEETMCSECLTHHSISKYTRNHESTTEKKLKKVQEERLRYSEEVESMRAKMNAHVNQIEQNVITKLEDSENEIKSQLEKVLSVLSEKMKAVEILEGNVSSIKNYATDLQSFLGIHTLKTEIDKQK
ncbi:unnamed protein product [Mytilus coruscus]|uniref:B box-type domain-containing protein n=1 Tax=Mytilus coruscus TaxID=42192 RepID=A0A6J8F0E6_MYTCO|nr:unnamed protein product [Mytilus coruscus]